MKSTGWNPTRPLSKNFKVKSLLLGFLSLASWLCASATILIASSRCFAATSLPRTIRFVLLVLLVLLAVALSIGRLDLFQDRPGCKERFAGPEEA